MTKPVLYPWLQEIWQRLLQQHQQSTLAHAYLISGIPGLGKRDFARCFAQVMLCQTPADGMACGHCKTCHLMAANTLPDYYELAPDGKANMIRIDQVRKLCEHLGLTAQIGRMKVAVIDTAEAMNTASANSLLKTLEEPTEHTLILLVSDYPHRLLPTIRSRCQQINIKPPEQAVALSWLQSQQVEQAETLLSLTAGAPVAALKDSKTGFLQDRQAVFNDFIGLIKGKANVLQVADQWQKERFPDCLLWLRSWVEDMIRLKLSDAPPMLENTDLQNHLQATAKRLDLKALYARLSLIQTAIQQASTTVNRQMLLDQVLYPWDAVKSR